MPKSRLAAALGVLLAVTGCGRIQPWVKPYEREHLADRVMIWDRDAISTAYINHVHENREEARGGTGSTGGGCGCN
jgi:hypothetical protein